MTDEFSGGSSPSQGPVSIPDSMPASAPTSQDEVHNTNRHVALEQMARSEDISDYAQERQDQVEALDEGRELPQERRNQWLRRASKALSEAAAEAAGFQLNGQQPQPIPPSYQSGAQHDTETYTRNTGSCAERVNQYLRGDEQKRQSITEWHQAMDPQSTVADWIIANNSPMAGQIMERCADNPEGLRTLAEMPPHERSHWLSKLEGHLEAEQRFGQQQAQQQQQWEQAAERRVSHAPPPIRKMPSGGANPPRNIHSLAQKDNVDDYVKARKAMKDL